MIGLTLEDLKEQSQGKFKAAMKRAELVLPVVCQDDTVRVCSQYPSPEVRAWAVPVV